MIGQTHVEVLSFELELSIWMRFKVMQTHNFRSTSEPKVYANFATIRKNSARIQMSNIVHAKLQTDFGMNSA